MVSLRPMTTAHLIAAWEQGLAQGPIRRALTLISAAWPEAPPESLAALPIGQRDALLLALREAAFGSHIEALAACPACGEALELTFDVDTIRAAPPSDPTLPGRLDVDGYKIGFRLPSSLDVEAVLDSESSDASSGLLTRCLLSIKRGRRIVSAESLPATVKESIGAAMAAADPQADVRLALTCPACGHGWQATFDIAAFLWSEVHAWATRVLHDVHALAAAYGWSEADVMALSPARRQFYIDATRV
jgi:hypothetical protein